MFSWLWQSKAIKKEEINQQAQLKKAANSSDKEIVNAIDNLTDTLSHIHQAQLNKESKFDIKELITICLLLATIMVSIVTYMVLKDTEKRQLRAYVFPKVRTIIDINTIQPFDLSIEIINHGLTPAHECKTSSLQVRFKANPIAPYSEPVEYFDIPQGVVAPGSEEHKVNITIPAKEFDSTRNINTPLVTMELSGKINYKDIFNEEHFTDICYLYTNDGKGKIKFQSCQSSKAD